MKLITLFCIGVAACAQTSPETSLKTSDPLLSAVTYDFGVDGSLTVEPGVRYSHRDGMTLLSTYDGSKIAIQMGEETHYLSSPATLQINEGAWTSNGKAWKAGSLSARRSTQDDTDSNLKSMQESAKKLKAKNDANPANVAKAKKLRVRWLYGDNPFATSELFNSQGIQQLIHIAGTSAAASNPSVTLAGISPVGF
jgi:hypothetical protein